MSFSLEYFRLSGAVDFIFVVNFGFLSSMLIPFFFFGLFDSFTINTHGVFCLLHRTCICKLRPGRCLFFGRLQSSTSNKQQRDQQQQQQFDQQKCYIYLKEEKILYVKCACVCSYFMCLSISLPLVLSFFLRRPPFLLLRCVFLLFLLHLVMYTQYVICFVVSVDFFFCCCCCLSCVYLIICCMPAYIHVCVLYILIMYLFTQPFILLSLILLHFVIMNRSL